MNRYRQLLLKLINNSRTYPIVSKKRTGIFIGSAIALTLTFPAISGSITQALPDDFSAYTHSVLFLGPSIYYHLDELIPPTAHDSSGNLNNGTYVGQVSPDFSGIFGLLGDLAIRLLNGGSVSAPSVTAMQGSHDRTVEIWFKTQVSGNVNQNLITTGAPGTGQAFDMALVGDNGPGGGCSHAGQGFYLRLWDSDLHFPIEGLRDGNWHYVAVTIFNNGTQANVVIDGKSTNSAWVWNGSCYLPTQQTSPISLPHPANTATAPIGLGSPGWGTRFSGSLDEFAVYPTALNPNSLINHYLIGSGKSLDILINGPGHILNGSPGTSTTWTVATFSALPHPGYPIGQNFIPNDFFPTTVSWGDGSISTPPINCFNLVIIVNCSVKASHTYTNQGSYVVETSVQRNDGRNFLLGNEAIIFTPSNDNSQGNSNQQGNAGNVGPVTNSIGELISETHVSDTDPTKNTIHPCTATVIHSVTESTIITAAHCVMDIGDGTKYTNFSFSPNHSGPTCLHLANCGTNPFGVWTATSQDVTFNSQVIGGHQRLDYAFIRVHPQIPINNIEKVVGGVPLTVNSNPNQSWTSYGYPTGSQLPNISGDSVFNLAFLNCTNTAQQVSQIPGIEGLPDPPGPEDLWMLCNSNLTEGSSGGPWIANNSDSLGAINQKFFNGNLLGTYLSDEAEQDFLKATLGF